MRIIAGSAGGRKLVSPSNNAIRPTGDRVRESLFSILGNVYGAVVFDAFSGTGALGCEALSRGAQKCYFFDLSSEAVSIIQQNVGRLGFEDNAIISQRDSTRGFDNIVHDEIDLCFIDPPYQTHQYEKILAQIETSKWFNSGCLIVLECDHLNSIHISSTFEEVDRRNYGQTTLIFLRYL